MPQQEKGIRPACALPYELYADGELGADKTFFLISMVADNLLFEDNAAGSPFIIYSYGKELKIKNYTVSPGDQLFDKTLLNEFENDVYNIELRGPNGFFRSFKGDKNDSNLQMNFRYDDVSWNVIGKHPSFTGKIVMSFINPDLQNKAKIR